MSKLDDALTSVIAGHPGAVNLWTFYEVIDGYLEPWGNSGYPIAYGKRYCERLTTNTLVRYPTRQMSPASAQAVARITVMCAKP